MNAFGSGNCGEVRRRLDQFLDNELPAGTVPEIQLHLESCEQCALELSRIKLLRGRIREAVATIQPAPGLEAGIRGRLQTEAAGRRRWLVAAGVLIAIAAGLAGGHFANRWRIERAEFQAAAAQLAEVLQPGLGDHIHCALFRRYPKDAPRLESLVRELGRGQQSLIAAVARSLPAEFRTVLAHRCKFRGRKFVHFVFRDGSRIASLAITKKRAGESLGAGREPVRAVRAGRFEVAAFESEQHLAYVVSEMPAAQNLQLALAVRPAVRKFPSLSLE